MSEIAPRPDNAPDDADDQPVGPPNDQEVDRKAASTFMNKIGHWITQSKPGPIAPEAEQAVQVAAEADAAKVPIFMASVMRRKVALVIRMWDALEKAFDKMTDPDKIEVMDAEEVGVLFDRLCREEDRHMKSIFALKGVIEGINWAEIEAIVSGESRVKAAGRLPAADREALRAVLLKAIEVPGDKENDVDPELDKPGLAEEDAPVEPEPIDVEFTVIGTPEPEPCDG